MIYMYLKQNVGMIDCKLEALLGQYLNLWIFKLHLKSEVKIYTKYNVTLDWK